MEGDEGEHAGVDEQHHEDGAQEPDELSLPPPEQARTEIDYCSVWLDIFLSLNEPLLSYCQRHEIAFAVRFWQILTTWGVENELDCAFLTISQKQFI